MDKDVWGVVMHLTIIASEVYFDWLLFISGDVGIETH
jgi:hypothetical protein